MRKTAITVLAVTTVALVLPITFPKLVEARPIREGNRYWEFSWQEVSSVMGEFGLRGYMSELNRRCNEGHRTQNKPWGRTGRYESSGTRHFCTV